MTPPLTPRQTVPWFLGALAVIVAVFVAPSYCGRRAAVTLDHWTHERDSLRAEVARLGAQRARADTIYRERIRDVVRTRVAYTGRVDSVLVAAEARHDTVTVTAVRTVQAASDSALAAADSALAAGERRVAARDSLIGTLRAAVRNAERKPGPPRLTRSALLAYDPLHGVPVGGVAVELRVVGRLALAAQADYALDPGLPPARRARVMVGVRIPF